MQTESRILIDERIILIPDSRRTNVCREFEVTDEFSRLIIECEYTPKKLENMEISQKHIERALDVYEGSAEGNARCSWKNFVPLYNLVTFSLDCGDEYIGCAHRHSSTQIHIISSTFSSPGFIRKEITKGRWRAVVNVHEILHEKCVYHFKITGDNGNGREK